MSVGRILHKMFGKEYAIFFENKEAAIGFAEENKDNLDIIKVDEI